MMLCIFTGRIAWLDMTQRRIKNHDILILALLGFVINLSNYSQFNFSIKDVLIASGIAFLAFIPFYTVGWMGAADVKLAAALGIWLGLDLLFPVWLLSVCMAIGYAQLANWGFLKGRFLAVYIRPPAELSSKKFIPYGAMLCVSTWLVGGKNIL